MKLNRWGGVGAGVVLCAMAVGCEQEDSAAKDESSQETKSDGGAGGSSEDLEEIVGGGMVEADAGATVMSADGAARLVIPPGALAEDTEITIELIEDAGDEPFDGMERVAVQYDLQPSGLEFEKPIMLEIVADSADLYPVEPGQAWRLFTATDDGDVEIAPSFRVQEDPEDEARFVGLIQHFSRGALALPLTEASLETSCTKCPVGDFTGQLTVSIAESAAFDAEVTQILSIADGPVGVTAVDGFALDDVGFEFFSLSRSLVQTGDSLTIDVDLRCFDVGSATLYVDVMMFPDIPFTDDEGDFPREWREAASFSRAFNATYRRDFYPIAHTIECVGAPNAEPTDGQATVTSVATQAMSVSPGGSATVTLETNQMGNAAAALCKHPEPATGEECGPMVGGPTAPLDPMDPMTGGTAMLSPTAPDGLSPGDQVSIKVEATDMGLTQGTQLKVFPGSAKYRAREFNKPTMNEAEFTDVEYETDIDAPILDVE